ncbi:MAG: WD40 repeat domain-containing protein, partial [Planctomycetales bacterium]|nr:WD40 repeat domain-containing protein [Planctomycetales bacterium]
LLSQIIPRDGEAAMPKQGPPLAEADIALIRQWIAQGAVDDMPPVGPKYSAQQPPVYSHPPLITALAYSPDGKWLAVSGFQEVLLLDAQTQHLERRLVGLSERIESLSFSPDSRQLAVTGGSPGRCGEVQVWDVDSGEMQISRQVTYDTIYGGCFSPDGKLVAFGCSDRTVRAIDAQSGMQVLHQGAHDDWVQACVFSPDGKHLVSAGRDMTVKLTEVETERFVDNITSITPGALRGGINALAIHPQRDEVLVGGSDGTPKIYRLFRQTERRIGDDANLIRSFPAMNGRIFSLAMGPGGKHFAAASTLDGRSQVVVYPYDFDGSLPDDVKAAMAKRIADRNDAEKQLIQTYTSQTSAAVSTLELTGNSVYALALSADGSQLALGGSDGLLRIAEVASGQLIAEVSPVPLEDGGQAKSESGKLVAGHGRPLPSAALPEAAAETQLIPSGELLELTVEPSQIQLQSVRDYVQLVITGVFADGQRYDLTRLATIAGPDAVEVLSSGLVRPLTAGGGQLRVSFGGL